MPNTKTSLTQLTTITGLLKNLVVLAMVWSLAAMPEKAQAQYSTPAKAKPAEVNALATAAKQTATKVSDALQLKLAESYGKLPLSFEANRGQTDGRVKFLSRGRGYSLFLASTEAVLVLRRPVEADSVGLGPASGTGRHTPQPSRSAALRLKLMGANPTPAVTGLEELPGKSNYFIGNDPKQWRTNVPNYGKVRFAGVYPGVDLVYYGNQRQLEYDFVVAPGADPSSIRLAFAGAQRVEIDPQGELSLHSSGGEVRWRKPVVYQEVGGVRKLVDGRYVRKGRKNVALEVAAYNRRQPLIIDPVLIYSTYLGGNGTDTSTFAGIAVDSSVPPNAYVVGTTTSINFPTTPGVWQPALGGSYDAFVSKLKPDGSGLVYSTYLGGSDFDQGNSIAVDASGNAYMTGGTNSTNFPTTIGAFQTTFGGSTFLGGDAFVTKLNAAGNGLLYSTYLGGSGADTGIGIAVDSSGNAYVVGTTTSTNFPTTAGVLQTALGGSQDAFVTKLNPTGTAPLLYSTYLGGSDSEDGNGIAVDSSGNAYVVGTTTSTNFPTTAGVLQTALGGSQDAFVSKLEPYGSGLVYSTYLGGSGLDYGFGIAVDSSGNTYVAGTTFSNNFPTHNAFQTALSGGTSDDAFVTKLNPTGTAPLLYSTYLGGSGFEGGRGIAVDSSGNAYITGPTGSANFPLVNALQGQGIFGGGTQDAFVSKLDTTLSGSPSLVYSTYLGGNGADYGLGIAVDSSGNAYVTGSTASTNFPTTAGAFQTAFQGGTQDAFVSKIGAAVAPTLASIVVTPANPTIAQGSTQQFTATGTYSDSSTQDLTASVTWSSGNMSVATITAGGLASGVAAGTALITATSGSISGSTTLTVIGPTPAQMVADLIITVQGMNLSLGTSLIDQLQIVENDIATQNGLACSDLHAFANEVKAQAGKFITKAQANQLLTAVASVEAALNCGP